MWFDALESRLVKKVLPRYVKVVKNKLPADFQIAKRIVFDFDKSLTDRELWKIHKELMEKYYEIKITIDKKKLKIEDLEVPRFSLLDLKILLVKDMMKCCELCEWKCRANRTEGELGICKVGNKCLISSEFVHMGEEPWISPSHTIFFMGCPFKCQYCQNWTISQWYEKGIPVTSQVLARMIEDRKNESRNVNLVGGEPIPSLLWILEALKECKVDVATLWNSNMYMSEKSMEILDGVIDMYLSDFKYGNDECASRLSKIPRYFEVCSRNHLSATKQAEITLRHLVLPNHVDCCSKPVLKWIAENIRREAFVNIMDQYRPEFKAREHPEINRQVTDEELKEVVDFAKGLKLNFIS